MKVPRVCLRCAVLFYELCTFEDESENIEELILFEIIRTERFNVVVEFFDLTFIKRLSLLVVVD